MRNLVLISIFCLLHSCTTLEPEELKDNYPLGEVTCPAQKGDVITELSVSPKRQHLAQMNHTASLRAFNEYFLHGLDINTPDVHGVPAVGHAAALGDMEYLQTLIDQDADLHYPAAEIPMEGGNSNIVGYNELSPVGLAAHHGHTAAVRLLLEHGATPRGVQVCIQQNRLGILKILKAAGANLHEGEYCTDGVFFPNTCEARTEEMLRYLINNGISKEVPFQSLAERCGNKKEAEYYIGMYLRNGIWTKEQAKQFREQYAALFKPIR